MFKGLVSGKPTDMLLRTLCASLVVSSALSGIIPSPGDIFYDAYELVYQSYLQLGQSIDYNYFDPVAGYTRRLCNLYAVGDGGDDTDIFMEAVQECRNEV